jgi:hypothetical protein
MSKPNKVNKGNYVQAGRLTPDAMAREREKVRGAAGGPPVRGTGGPKAIGAEGPKTTRGERGASPRRSGRE